MIIQNTIIGGTSAIICLSHEKVSTHYPFSILVYLIIKKFQKKKKKERERYMCARMRECVRVRLYGCTHARAFSYFF